MAHYYDVEQDTPLIPHKILVAARGQQVELWSGNGVFSKDDLDSGSKLLIDTAIIKPGSKIHDLGCGIGVVGIIAKMAERSCKVTCSDVSNRAIELTKMNVELYKLDLQVVQSDGYSAIPDKFDAILFNPPYVAGRQTIYRLIDEACEHLADGGMIQLVARHNKGGETLKKYLLTKFDTCDDTRRGNGYRVYICVK